MPTNVFISFERHDLEYVNSIRGLANNPQHDLEIHDRSEIKPVTDRNGKPLQYPPHHDGAKPIKKELKRLLKKATKMVVVIGKYTHESDWVTWEIQSFHDRYSSKSDDGDKRVIALFIPEAKEATLPRIIRTYAIKMMQWNMNTLAYWINANPNQELPTLPFP